MRSLLSIPLWILLLGSVCPAGIILKEDSCFFLTTQWAETMESQDFLEKSFAGGTMYHSVVRKIGSSSTTRSLCMVPEAVEVVSRDAVGLVRIAYTPTHSCIFVDQLYRLPSIHQIADPVVCTELQMQQARSTTFEVSLGRGMVPAFISMRRRLLKTVWFSPVVHFENQTQQKATAVTHLTLSAL